MENLDALLELEVLRLGNNKIGQKAVIIYLRRLPRLRTLSLKGNPVTRYYVVTASSLLFIQYYLNLNRFKDFEGYVAAFLPQLMYYEFKVLDITWLFNHNINRQMVEEKVRKVHTDKNQGEIYKVRIGLCSELEC